MAVGAGTGAGGHRVGTDRQGFGVAVLDEQDLGRLAAQQRRVGRRQPLRMGEQPPDGLGAPAARGVPDGAVEGGAARRHLARLLGFLGHRHRRQVRADIGGEHDAGRRRRRGRAARQAAAQQRMDRGRVGQVGPPGEPLLKLGGGRAGERAEMPVGQDVPAQVAAEGDVADRQFGVEQRRLAVRATEVAGLLEGKDVADAGGLARRQRLRQGDAGAALEHRAWDGERGFLALGCRQRLGMRLWRRGPCQNCRAGNQRPHCRKGAAEKGASARPIPRMTGPVHTIIDRSNPLP